MFLSTREDFIRPPASLCTLHETYSISLSMQLHTLMYTLCKQQNFYTATTKLCKAQRNKERVLHSRKEKKFVAVARWKSEKKMGKKLYVRSFHRFTD